MIFKLVVLASFLSLALAQFPQACKAEGYDQAALCQQFVATFCTRIGTENLRLHDASRGCFNLANGNRCDFTAYNSLAEGKPSGPHCQTVLNNVTNGCPHGGQGQAGAGPNGVTFAVDPNVGPCAVDIGCGDLS